jgi:CDP-paratose 2-epimerase
MKKAVKLLVTGSSGLIGSECVEYFHKLGWEVLGIDNNMRADFFGPDGDTTWNLHRMQAACPHFRHFSLDIRDRQGVLTFFEQNAPFDLVVHAAGQPSHDLAAKRPFDDFDVNAVGTLNLLESTRRFSADAVFCFTSTNKVYGDAPNELPLTELDTRWDYASDADRNGINESMRIDASKHSIFGASKVAADVMVQEYGRYFGMKTVCFRGGCLTGGHHSAAELHGFLAYLFKATVEGRHYRVFGHKGKQVRDNIHAVDVCRAFHAFYDDPRCGEVYNLGGGRGNSISMLEAISLVETITGRKLDWEYVEESRAGDHICYISDLAKFQRHFPTWSLTKSLKDIFEGMAHCE